MIYTYYRYPKYYQETKIGHYWDEATSYQEQVKLKELLSIVKSGDVIKTREPSTLLGTVGNKRYPATTLLIKLITDLYTKGVIIDFAFHSVLNDSKLWFELLHYQKTISNEARQIGTRRKLLSGNLSGRGRNKIIPDWTQVKLAFAKGENISRMATQFQVSRSTIRNWRKELNG